MSDKDRYELGYADGESSVMHDWLFMLSEYLDIHVDGPMDFLEDVGPRLKWQPIDTAPKDETWVLVYEPQKEQSRQPYGHDPLIIPAQIRTARFISERDEGETEGIEGRWWCGEWFDSDQPEPTHWMPLPEPPR